MTYTEKDIQIIGDMEYEGSLTVTCKYNGVTMPVLFSEEQLMTNLFDIGECSDYLLPEREIKLPVPVINCGNPQFTWMGIDDFMGQNLNDSLAKKLVAHYLNNKTPKP